MSAAFLTAAASYFGLAETNLRKTEIFTDTGTLVVAFEIPLTDEDMEGIMDRMKAMQQASATEQQTIDTLTMPPLTRADWDALSQTEKSIFGSIARFYALGGVAKTAPTRTVTHVDAPEDDEPVKMDAVWLTGEECSDAQKQFASDIRSTSNEYLIQWAMLTDHQRNNAKGVING